MTSWHKPLLTLFGSRDHLTLAGQHWFIDQVPGAKRQPHQLIHQAGHCLTEDKGPEVALALLQFIDRPQVKLHLPQTKA
jgi:haloalkane dehalogenase